SRREAGLLERPLPCPDPRVDGVHERPIEVEHDGTGERQRTDGRRHRATVPAALAGPFEGSEIIPRAMRRGARPRRAGPLPRPRSDTRPAAAEAESADPA